MGLLRILVTCNYTKISHPLSFLILMIAIDFFIITDANIILFFNRCYLSATINSLFFYFIRIKTKKVSIFYFFAVEGGFEPRFNRTNLAPQGLVSVEMTLQGKHLCFNNFEPQVRFELTTPALQVRCTAYCASVAFTGAVGGIRTPDILITSEALWPTELQRHFLSFWAASNRQPLHYE